MLGVFWLFCFAFRVVAIGGLDPEYRLEKGEAPALQRYFSGINSQIYPQPEAGLSAGMTVGDGSGIPYFLKQDLQKTSTIHVVVVSGQNLTILAGFLMSLVTIIGRRKTIFLTLGVIIGYCLLTGLQIPVIRAGIMAGVTYTGQLLGKQVTGWWVLLATAALMLLWEPQWLLSISFQLSFLATLGVVVVAPVLVEYLHKVPEIIKEELAVTISAQAMTLPVIAYNFGQLSLVGIVVNLLIGWSIPLIMISGGLSILVGTISLPLAKVIGILTMTLLRYFLYLVQFFSDLPFSSLNLPQTNLILWLGYYLALFGLIWWMRLKMILLRHDQN